MNTPILDKLIRRNPQLFKGAVLNFLKKRKEIILKDLRETEEKLEKMEKKFGSYESFSKSMDDSFGSHEIWIEWKSLIELRNKLKQELKEIDEAYRNLIDEKQESSAWKIKGSYVDEKSILYKVDESGCIFLPLEWRKKFIGESNLVLLKIKGDKIVIEPVLFTDLEAFIDAFDVDMDPDAFEDYNKLKRSLLRGESEIY
ncbi:MAG: AbrB/MazE/SpoVT family DNA-binding domain-containing protein [Candidatus Njordarchaeia archaeon]